MDRALPRRAVILQHAGQLFATKGVAATSVREIGDSVGILSGSLYHHFPSKADMVSALIGDYLDDLTARYRRVLATGADPREQMSGLVHASLAAIEAHPHAPEIYQNSSNYLSTLPSHPQMRSAAEFVQSAWMTVLQAGVQAGEVRSDIPAVVLYRLLRDALWLSVRWFRPTRQYSRRRFADDFISTFFEGALITTGPHPFRPLRAPAVHAG